MYYTYTNIDKFKIFCVRHDNVALLTKRCSEWETRNHHLRIFRKVLTIRKNVDQNMNFYDTEIDIRLPFTDLSQNFRIYFVVFALKYFIHRHE